MIIYIVARYAEGHPFVIGHCRILDAYQSTCIYLYKKYHPFE